MRGFFRASAFAGGLGRTDEIALYRYLKEGLRSVPMSTAIQEIPLPSKKLSPAFSSPGPLPEEPFPETERVEIDGLPVDVLPTLEAMLDRIMADIRHPEKAHIFSINIHGANLARRSPRFRRLMRNAETMICDGMGILWASRMLPTESIPCRHAAGDYMPALLERLAEEGLTAFFLAGEEGVAEKALANLAKKVPHHTVIGCHHGYILKNPALEEQVISTINRLKPDILFIGMGMPLQEYWIEENRHRLAVRAFFPFGATLDYLSHKVSRCPGFLGSLGLEWFYRLLLEPSRMFRRYVLGNPEFMSRILWQSLCLRLAARSSRQNDASSSPSKGMPFLLKEQ